MTQAQRRARRGGSTPSSSSGGFTLIELVTVLVILAVISAFIASRGSTLNTDLTARLSEVRSQLRFLQLRAMKNGTPVGLECDSADGTYGARYVANSTTIALPGETSATISLSGKSMTMTSFFFSFDANGIPYTGATPTKIDSATNATISITAGGQTGTLTVTPETGFVP